MAYKYVNCAQTHSISDPVDCCDSPIQNPITESNSGVVGSKDFNDIRPEHAGNAISAVNDINNYGGVGDALEAEYNSIKHKSNSMPNPQLHSPTSPQTTGNANLNPQAVINQLKKMNKESVQTANALQAQLDDIKVQQTRDLLEKEKVNEELLKQVLELQAENKDKQDQISECVSSLSASNARYVLLEGRLETCESEKSSLLKKIIQLEAHVEERNQCIADLRQGRESKLSCESDCSESSCSSSGISGSDSNGSNAMVLNTADGTETNTDSRRLRLTAADSTQVSAEPSPSANPPAVTMLLQRIEQLQSKFKHEVGVRQNLENIVGDLEHEKQCLELRNVELLSAHELELEELRATFSKETQNKLIVVENEVKRLSLQLTETQNANAELSKSADSFRSEFECQSALHKEQLASELKNRAVLELKIEKLNAEREMLHLTLSEKEQNESRLMLLNEKLNKSQAPKALQELRSMYQSLKDSSETMGASLHQFQEWISSMEQENESENAMIDCGVPSFRGNNALDADAKSSYNASMVCVDSPPEPNRTEPPVPNNISYVVASPSQKSDVTSLSTALTGSNEKHSEHVHVNPQSPPASQSGPLSQRSTFNTPGTDNSKNSSSDFKLHGSVDCDHESGVPPTPPVVTSAAIATLSVTKVLSSQVDELTICTSTKVENAGVKAEANWDDEHSQMIEGVPPRDKMQAVVAEAEPGVCTPNTKPLSQSKPEPHSQSQLTEHKRCLDAESEHNSMEAEHPNISAFESQSPSESPNKRMKLAHIPECENVQNCQRQQDKMMSVDDKITLDTEQ